MNIPASALRPFEPHGVPIVSHNVMFNHIEAGMNGFVKRFTESREYMITSPSVLGNGLTRIAKTLGAENAMVLSMSGGKTYKNFRVMIRFAGEWRVIQIRAPRTDKYGTLME